MNKCCLSVHALLGSYLQSCTVNFPGKEGLVVPMAAVVAVVVCFGGGNGSGGAGGAIDVGMVCGGGG